MNDSQPKSAISGTNEDEKYFETVKKIIWKKKWRRITAYLMNSQPTFLFLTNLNSMHYYHIIKSL